MSLSLSLSISLLVFAVGVALVAGLVTGLAGFGFALVGTMALATALPPSTAVVVMLIPILAANLSLLGELDAASLRSCGRRFGSYVAAALGGTLIGMALIDRLPDAPLELALGVVTLGFVATAQRAVEIPGFDAVRGPEFGESTRAKIALGSVSGLLFGATNVGVQMVAYVRSRELSHGLFVGVIVLVFVGINAVRVGAAALFGLYSGVGVFALSVALAVVGVVGVSGGRRLRSRVPERERRWFVLALLSVIGVRLVTSGLDA
ncbi:MAG: sulfite exporter TauE/SafE family protein [Halalkalicoccus sp.]